MNKTKKQLQDELDTANEMLDTISEYYSKEVCVCDNDGWGTALRDLGDKVDNLLWMCHKVRDYINVRDQNETN